MQEVVSDYPFLYAFLVVKMHVCVCVYIYISVVVSSINNMNC